MEGFYNLNHHFADIKAQPPNTEDIPKAVRRVLKWFIHVQSAGESTE